MRRGVAEAQQYGRRITRLIIPKTIWRTFRSACYSPSLRMANAGQERRRTRVTCCAPAVPWLLGCSALRAKDRCARQARGLFCRAREALRAHFGIAILEPSLNLTLCDAKTSGDSNVVRHFLLSETSAIVNERRREQGREEVFPTSLACALPDVMPRARVNTCMISCKAALLKRQRR